MNDKSQNLRRLQAQRNELNAKGEGREMGRLHVGSWSEVHLTSPDWSLHIGAFVFFQSKVMDALPCYVIRMHSSL